MATRLGRVIYWLMSGLAALTAVLGIFVSMSQWPFRAPPTAEAIDLADITTAAAPGNKVNYTFKFADGAKYLVEGPTGVADYAGARQTMRDATARELSSFQERREAALLPLGGCLAIAAALYLFGRAARYVLANE